MEVVIMIWLVSDGDSHDEDDDINNVYKKSTLSKSPSSSIHHRVNLFQSILLLVESKAMIQR